MAIKELKTRIALKYDSYSAWTTAPGKDLVLLAGELGICEIPSANPDSNVAPTVLFKVGDGTKTFEALPWASAKAADVYGWAKASKVERSGKKLVFVGGKPDGSNLEVEFDYVTLDEVKAITNGLDSRITALEGKFDTNGDVALQLAGHESRLDVIEGEDVGSIKKAAADAQAAAETAAAADATSKANAAEAAAKEHATGLNTAMNTRVETLEAAKTAHDGRITANANAIAKEVEDRAAAISGVETAYKAADAAIEEKIGGAYTKDATVHAAIVAAKQAADAAQADVDALTATNGAVTKNTADIAQNKADIEQLGKDLAAEAKTRKDNDDAIIERLEEVEAFFATAEDETLDTALDTLKEIQDYLNGEGEATGGMIGRVAAAEEAIEDLEDEFAASGRVTKAEADIVAVAGRAATLENIVNGYTGTGSIKTAVDAAQKAADDAASAAGVADGKAVAAQNAADKAQGEVDALELVVAGVKTTAEDAQTRVAAVEPKVVQAEEDIAAIKVIVETGDNANSKLRTDITSLQELTGDAAKGNAALHNELTRVAGLVDNTNTGLAATKAVADSALTKANDNASAISAIQGDYLKAADEYIFNCGTATTITHEKKAN